MFDGVCTEFLVALTTVRRISSSFHYFQLYTLPQVEIDSLTPALAASLPESHSEICCFDSRYTVLRPRLCGVLADYTVRSVRAGAGHTVVMCTAREGKSSGSSGGVSNGASGSGVGIGSGTFGVPPLAPGKSSGASAGAKAVSSKYDSKQSPYTHTTPLTHTDLDYSDNTESTSSKSNTNSNNSTSTSTLYPHLAHSSHPSTHKVNKTQLNTMAGSLKPSSNDFSQEVFSWVTHKRVPELSTYLTEGSDPNIVDSAGNTPLIVACQNGHFGVVKMFLTHGADINASNHKGNTALHYCMNYGYEDIGNFLIENGADDFQTNA